jgi:hypothetical protein
VNNKTKFQNNKNERNGNAANFMIAEKTPA